VRYLVKCKLNSDKEKDRLAKDIKSGSLARGKIFYEGMPGALKDATIDENDEVLLPRRRTIFYGNGDSGFKTIL
jgi:hypothetical protein